MEFLKYHGAGNDFVLIDNRNGRIKEEKKKALAVKLCHRNFGIGGDGLLLVEKASKDTGADVRMRIFNPDGSEAEMCGNGIRCVASYAASYIFKSRRKNKKNNKTKKISIETLAGVREVAVSEKKGTTYVRADMGEAEEIRLNRKLKVDGKEITYCYLTMGVPHAVVFTGNLERIDVGDAGKKIRFDKVFSKGANVNFVEKSGKNKFRIRTYERGVEKETLACGTGIVASAACAVLLGHADGGKDIKLSARGGDVYAVIRKERNSIRGEMTGPVEFVFRGDVVL